MPQDSPSWTKDFSLWWALLVGAFLRVLPLALWQTDPCLRDECTYLRLSKTIASGEGMVASDGGWLWAPGYPAIMALHRRVLGYAEGVVGTQILVFSVAIVLGYLLARQVAGQRAGRWAAWLLACSPTLVFFGGHLWSESFYTTLLIAAVFSLGWSRRGSLWRALLPGALVGACVLFRGVATYMLPIFALGFVWQRWGERRAWMGAGLVLLAGVAVVAPYSAYATQKFGGLVISDATLGQMMWLGDNDFAPATFDWGAGVLDKIAFKEMTAVGRAHCDKALGAKAWDACEVAAGKAWISEHPLEFLRRVPLRWAQLFNPNSFVTRHVRIQRWPGLPVWVAEPMLLLTIAFSLLAVLGGLVGALARGRGWMLLVTMLVVGYHVAAIGLVAGLSRYRVPLDALFLIWTATWLADPKAAMAHLQAAPWRFWLMTAGLLITTPLMAWFLLPGYLR